MSGLDEYLDVLGDSPSLHKLYTQIAFCFPLPSSDPSLPSKIIQILNRGLERLSSNFPWLAGHIGVDDAGVFKILPYEKVPQLIVKDLRNEPSVPTWNELKEAKFPMRMLDESVICPRNTLPDPIAQVAPVLLLQVTWIKGGMLLSIVAQHNTMDMTGQAAVIELFSKACCGEEFTSEELATGNPDRRSIIPLLDDSYEPGSELANQMVKPVEPDSAAELPAPPPGEYPKCSWAYFIFSPESLTALKKLATESLECGYVSTDDVLTAFIWQSILRARLPRLSPRQEVNFARAVDARRYIGASPNYPGILQNMTYHSSQLSTLLSKPLGHIASQFRAAVDPKTSDIKFRTQALVTYLTRPTSDRSKVNFTANLNLDSDIMLSSWAKVNCYDTDFGLGLGKPVAVRRPQFFPVQSLLYLMPRRGDGEIAAALCLRDEDLGRLRNDGDFSKYAEYVG